MEGQSSALWTLARLIELASIYWRHNGRCPRILQGSLVLKLLIYIDRKIFTLPRYRSLVYPRMALEETIFEN